MALGDIVLFTQNPSSGGITKQVNSGSAASINAGEPVLVSLGQQYAATLATNKPVVATDYIGGIALTTSTDTASAAGTVSVLSLDPSQSYLISPKVAATFNTQAKYNALVGSRVLLDKTSGVYTILAADGATNGCVILDLNITTNPGKVRFAFRAGCSYLS